MKRLLSTSAFILTLICLFHTTGFAQDRPFQVGVGLLYGSEIEELGIQANLNYPVLENIELAPDISIYFVDDDGDVDNFWELNLNGHYFLSSQEQYNVYGLAGLNLATIGNSFTDDSETEIGINIGVGSEYYMDAFSLFGELKYVLSDFDQLVIGVGARLAF